MNMNMNPTLNQLVTLYLGCNDDENHHILWVAENGDVHLDLIPEDLTPRGFAESQPTMKIRFETYIVGNGYVGEDASNDIQHMGSTFDNLIERWGQFKDGEGVRYIDF